MARAASADEKVPEPPMTPMIDVVFQLLIFFMLSMHFRETEGTLMTQLPRDLGQQTVAPPRLDLPEIRITICAGGDLDAHAADKKAHDFQSKNNAMCRVAVRGLSLGDVAKTTRLVDKSVENRAVYDAAAKRVRQMVDATPVRRGEGRQAPVIIDTDSETPYEHVIGIIDACKRLNIDNVEFTPNPRLADLEKKR